MALAVSAAGAEELTSQQQQTLLDRCEQIIDLYARGSLAAGFALTIVHNQRLYKAKYDNFENYVEHQWGIGRRHAYQLIDAATVVQNVRSCAQFDVLPTNEFQARKLVELEPAEQVEVWKCVVESTPPAEITAKIIEEHVTAFLGRQADEAEDEPDEGSDVEEREELTPDAAVPAAEPIRGVVKESRDDEIETPDRRPSPPTSRAFQQTAIRYLREVYGSGEPKPAPDTNEIEPELAVAAWVNETPLPEEQERRRKEIDTNGPDNAVVTGKTIVSATFWAMVWLGIIEKVGGGKVAKYRQAEKTPVTVSTGKAVQ
jgi:hypothetical protein